MKAIVIGAGPSIYDKNHLEILARSQFDGYVLPCDRILGYALNHGITPDKFLRYYTATIDDHVVTYKNWSLWESFFNQNVIKRYASKIGCFVSSYVHSKQRKFIQEIGIQISGYYKRLGMSDLYPVPDGSMIIDDCGNVCMALWSIAKNHLQCDKIGMIGVDLSYSKYDTNLW